MPPDLDAACFILAQVVTALADLHRHSRDLSHGAIGPERIVIGPDGRAVIVEPVLAPMLEQLQLARTPLWTEFRVPVPPVAGTARFDQVTDVMQLGVLALALVLGRPMRRDEYPNRLHDLMLEVVRTRRAGGPAGGLAFAAGVDPPDASARAAVGVSHGRGGRACVGGRAGRRASPQGVARVRREVPGGVWGRSAE